MIVLVLTAAQAGEICDALPDGALKASIGRELAIDPSAHVPELVIARPRWDYVECCYDAATARRCWAALVVAWRGPRRVAGKRPCRSPRSSPARVIA